MCDDLLRFVGLPPSPTQQSILNSDAVHTVNQKPARRPSWMIPMSTENRRLPVSNGDVRVREIEHECGEAYHMTMFSSNEHLSREEKQVEGREKGNLSTIVVSFSGCFTDSWSVWSHAVTPNSTISSSICYIDCC